MPIASYLKELFSSDKFYLRLFIAGILLMAGTVVLLRSRGEAEYVRPGEHVPKLTAKDSFTKTVAKLSSARHNFIVYVNHRSARSLQEILYMSQIAKRYPAADVAYFAVLGQDLWELSEMHRNGAVTIPVILDQSLEIAKAIRIPHEWDGTVITDRDGTVVLAIPYVIEPEDVRELSELYVTGSVNYASAPAIAPPVVGGRLPDIEVKELASGKRTTLASLSSQGARFWIFTANCPVCSLLSFLKQLKNTTADSGQIIPVFSARVPEPILRVTAQREGIKTPLYVSTEALTGFEDSFRSKSLDDAPSFLVCTDNRGIILSMAPQDPLAARSNSN